MLKLFDTNERLKKAEAKAEKLENDNKALDSTLDILREEVLTAQNELGRVKHEHKMADEDIKHMVKMQEEKAELELEKAKIKYEGKLAEGVSNAQKEYQVKITALLEKQIVDVQDMTEKVLERLPVMTAHMGTPTTIEKSKD